MIAPLTTIAAILPVYNPEPGLCPLCQRLLTHYAHVIVVDDGSIEQQADFNQLPAGVTLLHHPVNYGKGRAIKTALSYVLTSLPDVKVVVLADADGQHAIEDIQAVATKALSTNCITFGVRDFFRKGVPFRSRFGNLWTILFVWTLVHIYIRDTQTGLRAIPRQYIQALSQFPEDGFEYESRMFGFLRRNRLSFEQVPIQTIYLASNRTSHFQPLPDTYRIFKVLFKDAYSLWRHH